MGPRVWAGLALVMLSLAGLAAVLPQGETDFDELRPDKFRPPKNLPNTPTPSSLPDLPDDLDLGSFVKALDPDTQFDLEDLPDFQRYNHLGFQDLDGNGRYDAGEPMYLQNQPGTLRAGDLSLGDGAPLGPRDSRLGAPTLPLEDAEYAYQDRDANGRYTPGEPIFLDVDGSGTVSVGDLRLSDADPQYGPQTQVRAGDADIGRALRSNGMPQIGDESYYDRNGNGRLDDGDGLYLDVDDSGNPSEGDLRMGVIPAGDAGPSGGLSDEEKAALAAAALAAGLSGQRSQDPNDYRAGPTDPGSTDYASDRNGAAGDVTCINFYSYGSTCHNRGAVFASIQRTEAGEYLFLLDDGPYTTLSPASAPSGTVASTGSIPLQVAADRLTPVSSLTPDQHLVSFTVTEVRGTSGTPQITLLRDENDMVWARSDRSAFLTLRITWAVDPDYFDLYVPPSLRPGNVPSQLRPVVAEDVQRVGREIAAVAGAHPDQTLEQMVERLRSYFSGFGEGPIPGEDEHADDMLAITYGKNGCCRHRAEAFTVAAQSLGVPTRMVVNEAHAFAEVYVPGNGWRLVDLGGCGDYDVQDRQSHEEAPTDPDTPVRDNLDGDDGGPPPDPAEPPISTTIEITSTPARLRRNVPFEIAGNVNSANGALPAGIPITFYYNETKEAPGTRFCTGATDGDTGFRSTCTFPSDAPVGDFQLVARLSAGRMDGRPTAVAYSDPPFSVESPTSLRIEGPARTLLGANQAYLAVLLDEFGQPVVGATVRMSSDGTTTGSGLTDLAGRATLRVPFTATGPHTLQARFDGDDHYGPSAATLTVTTLDVTIEADVEDGPLAQDEIHVVGSIRDAFGPLGDEAVNLAFQGKVIVGRTDDQGRLDLRMKTPVPPGNHTVQLQLAALDASTRIPFTKTVEGVLEAKIHERWSDAHPLRLPVQARFADSAAGLRVEVLLDGARAAVLELDDDANATWVSDAPLARGRHEVIVRLLPAVGFGAPPAQGQVLIGNVSLPRTPRQDVVAAGASLDLAGSLAFDGASLHDHAIQFELGAARATATTRRGDWSSSVPVPANLPLGTSYLRISVPAIGYDAQQEVPVGRPTRIDADIPRVSWRWGGTIPVRAAVTDPAGTPVDVPLEVRANGQSVAPVDGTYPIDAGTWLAKTIAVTVEHPGRDEHAAAAQSSNLVIINPIGAGLLGAGLLAAVGATLLVTRRGTAAARSAAVPSALTARPTSSVRLLRPALPNGVPPILDPHHDPDVVVQAPPGAGAAAPRWRSGHAMKARAEEARWTVETQDHPLGPDELVFEAGETSAVLPLRFQPFHDAVDEAFRAIASTVLKKPVGPNEPIRLSQVEWALQVELGASEEAARRARSTYEIALYARQECTRHQFEAFFVSLDQLRPQAPTEDTA